MARIKIPSLKFSDFQRHMMVQSSGTVLSQLVPILAAPFLTRLYSPSDFGLFGAVISIATLLAIVVTLRLDHGIIVSDSDHDAKQTAVLALCLAFGGGVLFACVAALSSLVRSTGDTSEILTWAVLCPLCGVLSAATRTLTMFNNRLKYFSLVSRARLIQSFGIVGASILFGLLALHFYGLILGLIVGNLIYVSMLSRPLWGGVLQVSSPSSIIRRNAKFIFFSLPADIISTLTARMPFLVFPALYGLEQTGYLALAYRVVASPAKFVGTAIGEVFYSHAAREYEREGNCLAVTRSVSCLLATIGAVGFVLLFTLAPFLFDLVFGADWRPAAVYTQILIPMLYLGFVASPLSAVFYIASRQKEDLVWQIGLLCAMTGASFYGLYSGGIEGSLVAISAAGVTCYLVYLILIWKYSSGPKTAGSENR